MKSELNLRSKVKDSAGLYQSYHYEHDRGKLIYAIVRDDSEANARAIALNIIRSINNDTGGSKVYAQ